MGMFDYINAPCPKCGEINEDQTKLGPCILNIYNIEDAEIDLEAAYLYDGQEFECESCGTKYKTKNICKPKIIVEVIDET
jgi:predicted RNA-binding Zn-ribbon protein involved in translation (DUF1610 family)